MYLTWFSGPTISPDGGRLAYVAEGGVWVRDLDRVEARRVADVDDRTSVFWSPDGAHIGYFAQARLANSCNVLHLRPIGHSS